MSQYPITPSMLEDERLMRRECPPEFRETLERWLAACRAELLRQEHERESPIIERKIIRQALLEGRGLEFGEGSDDHDKP